MNTNFRKKGERVKKCDAVDTGSGCWNAKQKRLNEHVVLYRSRERNNTQKIRKKIYDACFHLKVPPFSHAHASYLPKTHSISFSRSFVRSLAHSFTYSHIAFSNGWVSILVLLFFLPESHWATVGMHRTGERDLNTPHIYLVLWYTNTHWFKWKSNKNMLYSR